MVGAFKRLQDPRLGIWKHPLLKRVTGFVQMREMMRRAWFMGSEVNGTIVVRQCGENEVAKWRAQARNRKEIWRAGKVPLYESAILPRVRIGKVPMSR